MGAQSVGVKGTAQTSSFSGSASRQERRLRNEIPACLERGTIIGHQGFLRAFRKNRCSGKRTHLVQNTPLPAKSRTTNLGPFGELIRATGPMAKLNPFRFSTKYQDDETDLIYYGYRYYNASIGRWLSRDPLAERGGKNLYGFVNNNPVRRYDRLGLASYVAAYESYSLFSDTSEVDLSATYTEWYENRFPNTKKQSLENFTKQIGDSLKGECKPGGNMRNPQLPSTYIGNYGTGEGQTISQNDIDESNYGDKRQSSLEAALALGRYNIQVRDFSFNLDTNNARGRTGCCFGYNWSANVVVLDTLGLDISNLGDPEKTSVIYAYEIFSPALPKRTAIVAKWPISGNGICCYKYR